MCFSMRCFLEHPDGLIRQHLPQRGCSREALEKSRVLLRLAIKKDIIHALAGPSYRQHKWLDAFAKTLGEWLALVEARHTSSASSFSAALNAPHEPPLAGPLVFPLNTELFVMRCNSRGSLCVGHCLKTLLWASAFYYVITNHSARSGEGCLLLTTSDHGICRASHASIDVHNGDFSSKYTHNRPPLE